MSDKPAAGRHDDDSEVNDHFDSGFDQELDEALGEISLESLIDLDIPRGVPFS
ncbi:MAG: hypothetical protein GX616_06220, partial [Planctomycetes bacterium]|nr:hypothetical protein [Planctomycetota bacterium]